MLSVATVKAQLLHEQKAQHLHSYNHICIEISGNVLWRNAVTNMSGLNMMHILKSLHRQVLCTLEYYSRHKTRFNTYYKTLNDAAATPVLTMQTNGHRQV